MSFQDLLDKYGKHCPGCGSGQVTSGNTAPLQHRCLGCGLKFADGEAVIGKEAAAKVAEGRKKG